MKGKWRVRKGGGRRERMCGKEWRGRGGAGKGGGGGRERGVIGDAGDRKEGTREREKEDKVR